MKNKLTREEITEMYTYMQNTMEYRDNGNLYWVNCPIPKFNRKKVYTNIGTNGYREIEIKGHKIYYHRAIWLYNNGDLPDMLDHKDRNKLNNKLENLRVASPQLNSLNSRVSRRNITGVKGVSFVGQKNMTNPYRARIQVDGKGVCLGHYANIDDAKLARDRAEKAFIQACLDKINNPTNSSHVYMRDVDIINNAA